MNQACIGLGMDIIKGRDLPPGEKTIQDTHVLVRIQ